MTTPHSILKEHWGYDDFRPLQLDIVQSVLDGRDTIGLLPTGGGKSITFQVPALLLPGITVVVTPLISLMKDQVDNLRSHDIRAAYLHSGQRRAEVRYVFDRCDAGKLKLLYVAPERLASASFVAQLRRWGTSLIVVDEAHCISQWGYDFRPSYLRISALRDAMPHVPVLALTASATPAVVEDISRSLHMRSPNLFVGSFARPNISFLVRRTDDKFGKLLDILTAVSGSTIVYTRSRRRAAELAAQLEQAGVPATFYHAGLASEIKSERQEAWRTDAVRIMVATTAFGMGIDKPDVRLVVHYDVPSTLEEYYQEAGRAGRDGQPSVAVMLVSQRDKATLHRRLTVAFPPKEFLRHTYDEICRYLSVPMGEGFGAIYDFSPKVMCEKYHMQQDQVESAIALLARSEYFDFVEDLEVSPQLMFTVTRHQLYDIDFEPAEERVLDFILRTYPGIFTDLQFINEELIAYHCNTTRDGVYQILKSWRRNHIVSYVPARSTPTLYFTANRVESERLTFPREVYENRRRAMEQRIEAVIRFAYNDGNCRVRTMLEYFGETFGPPCGKCDVCRAARARSQGFDAEAFEKRLPEFFGMIAPHPWLDVRSLKPYYPLHYDALLQHLRAMAERGAIEISDTHIRLTK